MKIFVTGGGGYIGTTLVPYLAKEGHEVTVLDRFYFGTQPLEEACKKEGVEVSLIRGDIRHFSGKLLEGQDAVVDMAAISNDPAGELDPWKTFEINYLGRSRVARLAKEAGVKRYLLVSSCSIYGFRDGILSEESPINPLSSYAKANHLAEVDNLTLGDEKFTSTAVRLSTAFGLSARMRFDLSVNIMTANAHKTGILGLMRDGTQWRPYLHIKDIARALLMVLEAPKDVVQGQLFNVGNDKQNYQVKDIAEIVASSMQKRPSIEWYGDPDKRSYQVSFAKIKNVLGFEAQHTLADAVKEIEQALIQGTTTDDIGTKTVEWYKHLMTDAGAAQAVALPEQGVL